MPTPPLFRFALMLDDATWYYVQGGALYTSTIGQYLVHSPDGWENTELKWGRNLDYRTLLRSFSMPYKFVKEGAAIIRAVFCKEGIEGRCKLVIEKRQSTDWQYAPYFSGDIDFSTFVDNTVFCTCEIVEGGLSALIKAYASTPQEIELRDTSSIKLYSDGIKLKGTFNYINSKSSDVGGTIANVNAGDTFAFFSSQAGVDGDYPIAVNNNSVAVKMMQNFGNNHFTSDSIPDPIENFNLEALQGLEAIATLKQKFIVHSPGLAPFTFKVDLIVTTKDNPVFPTRINLFSRRQAPPYTDPNVVFDLDVTSPVITLTKYQRVYFIWWIENELSTGDKSVDFEEGKLTIQTTFRIAPSFSQSKRLYDLYTELCEKVAGSTGAAQSSLLNTPNLKLIDWRPFWTVATCGDALRGLYGPFQNKFMIPKIRTTFSDFIKTIQALTPVGFGVEGGKYVLEQLPYFFDRNTQVYDLGEVTELEVAVADEYYASNIRIGYEDQTYDGLNGKDEYNTTQSYKMPVVRTPGQVDFISPYRADMYGMEIYRANLSNKKTTDSKSDNDTFMVTIASTPRADGSYPVYRPQNTPGNTLTGVLFPDSAYNVDITPKHNLLRQGPWLKMMTYLQSGKKLTFQTTDKNPDVSSNLGSGTITENSDVAVNDLPDLPFLPVYLRFKKALDNLNELMSSYPKGYFRFTFKGQEFKGFLDSAGVKPAKLDLYQFQLLAHPELNLLQLLNACAQS